MSSTTSVWWLLFIMGRLTVYLILSLLRSRCCTIAWKLQSFSTSTSLSKRTHKKTFLTLMLWYENNKAASVLSFQIFSLLDQVWITVSRKQKKQTTKTDDITCWHVQYCGNAFSHLYFLYILLLKVKRLIERLASIHVITVYEAKTSFIQFQLEIQHFV